MDRCKNGYIINEDGTIPERCHVDWDDDFYPTVCKECPFYNSEYFMNTSEAINLLEVIKFCDVDELAKIKAINIAIEALEKQDPMEHHHTIVGECSGGEKIRTSICPNCLGCIMTVEEEFPRFCNWCGKAIDWSK